MESSASRTVAVTAALAMSLLAAPAAAGQRTVDDSYTVSQRFDAYHDRHPEFVVPTVSFLNAQQVLFDRRYKKVGDRELHVDVFLPVRQGRSKRTRSRAAQAVVLVHGGAWRSGNKSNFYPIATLLAQRGYAVFLPEFRLSPEAAYPAGLIDVNDAIVWIKRQAREFGIDAGRVAIGGESSGGQMAALLAYSADRPIFKSMDTDDTRVSALLDIDGVLDFTTPLALQFENAAGPASPAALWLGGSMEQIPERWKEASSATYVNEDSPPTLIIGSSELRFTAGREAVLSRLRDLGIRCQYSAFENTPHTFWLFDPYAGKVVDTIDDFLRAGR